LLVGGDDLASTAPRLTADGNDVLYATTTQPDNPTANLRLMRVPAYGGPSQLILEAPGIGNYQCARLPSTLCLYGQMDPHSDYYKLFAFDPAGTTGAEVLAGKIKKGDVPLNWSLSPNGKYLVTARSQNPYDDPALRIFNLEDGSEQVIPMPQMGLMMGMDWAADSKSIWVGGYMGRGAWGTRSGLIRVDLAGTTSVLLKGFNPEMWFAIPSPDGRQLALMGRTQSSNVWLLENF
jgi:hypothetical protein